MFLGLSRPFSHSVSTITNILRETEIDASSELLAIMDDETGTGALVFANSPTITDLTVTYGMAAATGTYSGALEGGTLTEGGVAVLNNDEMDASSELLAIFDDETGTGNIVFSNSPTIVDLTVKPVALVETKSQPTTANELEAIAPSLPITFPIFLNFPILDIMLKYKLSKFL